MTADETDNKIITFGCRLNAFESEAIKNAVAESGEKNLIVFNFSQTYTKKNYKILRISNRCLFFSLASVVAELFAI